MKANDALDHGRGPAFAMGLGLGALAVLALRRPSGGAPRATRLKLWQRLLAARLGRVDAALLAARVQARYAELHARRPHFDRLALRLHLDHNILPGLALYQVLAETLGDRQAALSQWDELVGSPEGSPAQSAIQLLDRVPRSFDLFRAVARGMMQYGFPAEGWTYHWVEDTPDRIAFTIERCFYQTVLAFYGAPELTEHFCRLDDLVAEKLPPTIRWSRTTTIGRGDPACNFCYTRVPPALEGGMP